MTIVSLGNPGNAAGVLELPLQTFFRPNAWRGVPRGAGDDTAVPAQKQKARRSGLFAGH